MSKTKGILSVMIDFLEKICIPLDCNIEDIMEFRNEKP